MTLRVNSSLEQVGDESRFVNCCCDLEYELRRCSCPFGPLRALRRGMELESDCSDIARRVHCNGQHSDGDAARLS